MNKLQTILLATILCSMVHGLAASEGQRLVFFDQQTKNNFKETARDYALCYVATWGAITTHNILNILRYRDQSLMHRKWTFMPEEYLKHPSGSSKFMNIIKDQGVIGKRLLGTLPKSLPFALVAAVIYDGYQKSVDRQ